MNGDQARALARLIHTIRPEWDEPGILAALRPAATADPLNAAMAALRWTASPETRTPGAMGKPGPHWSEAIAAPVAPQPPKTGEACFLCGRHVDRCTCDNGPTRRPPSLTKTAPTPSFRIARTTTRHPQESR